MDDENLPIEIPVEVQEIAAAQADLRAVAKEIEKLDKAFKQLKKDIQAAGAAAQTAAAQIRAAVSGANRAGSGASGSGAAAGGTRAAAAARPFNVSQLPPVPRVPPLPRMPRPVAAPPGVWQRIGQAVMSSRIGMSGGGLQLMPLVGRVLAVLGPVGAGLAAAGGAALAAGKSLFDMAKAAADAGTALNSIHLTSGGTAGESAQLSTYGKALGIDLGAMSREFADTISKGGAGTVFAGNAGITDFGTFDTTNKANKLLKWLEHLQKLPEEEAIREARATHTEGLLPARQLSAQTNQNLLVNDPALKSRILDPQFQKDALEFQVAMSRTGEAFGNLLNSAIKPFVPAITKFFDGLTDTLNRLASSINDNGNRIKGTLEMIGGILEVIYGDPATGARDIKDAWKDLHTDPNKKKSDDKQTSAQDRHTAAMEAHTLALKNGIFGGGERIRGAVPNKWTGMGRRGAQVWVNESSRLGAFAL